MGRNISLQEAGERWLKNSFRSYLEGEKNLKWVAGILKGADKASIQELFDSMSHHATPERKQEFSAWLNNQPD